MSSLQTSANPFSVDSKGNQWESRGSDHVHVYSTAELGNPTWPHNGTHGILSAYSMSLERNPQSFLVRNLNSPLPPKKKESIKTKKTKAKKTKKRIRAGPRTPGTRPLRRGCPPLPSAQRPRPGSEGLKAWQKGWGGGGFGSSFGAVLERVLEIPRQKSEAFCAPPLRHLFDAVCFYVWLARKVLNQ